MAFDPSKYGATPVVKETSTGFDPSKYGAIPVVSDTKKPAIPPTKTFTQKVGDAFTSTIDGKQQTSPWGKALGIMQTPIKATKFFVEPTIKALETGIAQIGREAIRPFSPAIAEKEISTPFGTVKDIRKQGLGETALQAVDVASFMPLGKLFSAGIKTTGKLGRGILTTVGEVATGVEKSKLNKWFDIAKNEPQKIDIVKDVVSKNPQEPFLGFAQKIGDRLNSMKADAKQAWQAGSEVFKKQFPVATFDLSYKVPELKAPLEKFGVTLKQAKDKAGKVIGQFNIVPKGKLNPFTPTQTKELQGLVDMLKNAKDFTVDDLATISDRFDQAYNSVKYGVDFKPTKFHAAVMSLKDEAAKFIDVVAPKELKQANKMYRDYYDALKNIGSKVLDASGEVKPGAETYLGNIMNLNRGAERIKVVEAGKKLGIDILDTADNLKIAKELAATVPNSTKNRTMDIIRAITGSQAFGGAAGVGTFFNPAVGVPAVLLNILSSPKVYSGLIETIAGTSSKIPVSEAIKKLSPQEMIAIQQLIKGIINAPGEINK